MRAQFESKAGKKGRWFSRRLLELHLTVEFSDAELAIIERSNCKDAIVAERQPTMRALKKLGKQEYQRTKSQYHLRVGNLLLGTDVFAFDTYDELMEGQMAYIVGLRELGTALIKAGADPRAMEISFASLPDRRTTAGPRVLFDEV